MYLKIIISIAIILLVVTHAHGLKCYTCSVNENDADTSCADDPEALGKSGWRNCDKKYCTITRIDYRDPKGKLSSLSRTCVDKVLPDGVTEDETFRTYQRSCKSDLCNDGSGTSDMNSANLYLGNKSTIYVPGTGRSSTSKEYSSAFGVVCCLIVVLRL